jgi:hypothetical protein
MIVARLLLVGLLISVVGGCVSNPDVTVSGKTTVKVGSQMR